jgi:sugar (pentulose or hexulose) kinase
LQKSQFFIGIDLGTSGCRGCLVDTSGNQRAIARAPLPKSAGEDGQATQQADAWWAAVDQVMQQLGASTPLEEVQAMAVDGTSGTLLLCDAEGAPLGPALMYNDRRATRQAAQVAALAPDHSGALGSSSSLSKWLYLAEHFPAEHRARPCHQADWILGRLCGNYGISDEHNALKLGFDPVRGQWPDWLDELGAPFDNLPRVYPAGTPVGTLRPSLARHWGLSEKVRLVTGTTDSTAGIVATGVNRVGQAVTSLGSTLVMKVLSPRPLFEGSMGIYSHRLGDLWLAGGASNSGGAVLEKYFTPQALARLTPGLQPDLPTGLDYYPLLRPGERFPDPDSGMPPRLEPRPPSDTEFLQGLLEGMARIEQRAYRVLQEQGAPYPDTVVSVGGGAQNAAWATIRARVLGIPVTRSQHQEAAYGTALLACRGFIKENRASGL